MTVFVLFAFSLSCLFVGTVFALKTTWFKQWPGRLFAGYLLAFVITGLYLMGRWAGWLSDEWQPVYYYTVIGGLAIWNVAQGTYTLCKNWHFWAWSK